jgi:hypothetical protein
MKCPPKSLSPPFEKLQVGGRGLRIDTVTALEDSSVWNHYSNVREALIKEVRVSWF